MIWLIHIEFLYLFHFQNSLFIVKVNFYTSKQLQSCFELIINNKNTFFSWRINLKFAHIRTLISYIQPDADIFKSGHVFCIQLKCDITATCNHFTTRQNILQLLSKYLHTSLEWENFKKNYSTEEVKTFLRGKSQRIMIIVRNMFVKLLDEFRLN